MTAEDALEPDGFTLADVDALPGCRMQVELVDGMLLASPPPSAIHQTALLQLASRLVASCPRNLSVLIAPLDFRPTAQRALQPDVFVCRREDVGPTSVQTPPLLVVEIMSACTRLTDSLLRRALYEEAGVASYWMFDPDRAVLTVLELVGECYLEKAMIEGYEQFEAELPFPVRIVPAELVG